MTYPQTKDGDYIRASVTLYHVGAESKRGRRALAKWLRGVAFKVERDGAEFGPKFTARKLTASERGKRPVGKAIA